LSKAESNISLGQNAMRPALPKTARSAGRAVSTVAHAAADADRLARKPTSLLADTLITMDERPVSYS